MLVRYSSTAQDLVTNAENSWDLGRGGGNQAAGKDEASQEEKRNRRGRSPRAAPRGPPGTQRPQGEGCARSGERGAGGQTEGQRGSCGTAEAAERKPEWTAPNAGERSGGTRPRPSRRRHPGWGGLCVRDDRQWRRGRPPPVSTRAAPSSKSPRPGAGRQAQSERPRAKRACAHGGTRRCMPCPGEPSRTPPSCNREGFWHSAGPPGPPSRPAPPPRPSRPALLCIHLNAKPQHQVRSPSPPPRFPACALPWARQASCSCAFFTFPLGRDGGAEGRRPTPVLRPPPARSHSTPSAAPGHACCPTGHRARAATAAGGPGLRGLHRSDHGHFLAGMSAVSIRTEPQSALGQTA